SDVLRYLNPFPTRRSSDLRSGTDAIHRVGGIGVAVVEMGGGGGGQVAARRKAQNPHPLRIEVPLLRIRADGAQCEGVEPRSEARSEEHTSELQSRGHLVWR